MPKRLQDQLRLGYPLGNSKNTIFDVKTSPRWLPKISHFFKNRLKILAMTVFGLRCLLEASKSLTRASQEPPRSRPRALKRLSTAFESLPSGPQEDSKSLLCRPFYILWQKPRQVHQLLRPLVLHRCSSSWCNNLSAPIFRSNHFRASSSSWHC